MRVSVRSVYDADILSEIFIKEWYHVYISFCLRMFLLLHISSFHFPSLAFATTLQKLFPVRTTATILCSSQGSQVSVTVETSGL